MQGREKERDEEPLTFGTNPSKATDPRRYTCADNWFIEQNSPDFIPCAFIACTFSCVDILRIGRLFSRLNENTV